MNRSNKIIGAVMLGAAACVGVGLVAAGAAGDEDEPDDDRTEVAITGDALEQASAAALAHSGGGRVTGSEVGDEESYYEIEVTLENGDQVDVQLDEQFTVVGDERDGANADD